MLPLSPSTGDIGTATRKQRLWWRAGSRAALSLCCVAWWVRHLVEEDSQVRSWGYGNLYPFFPENPTNGVGFRIRALTPSVDGCSGRRRQGNRSRPSGGTFSRTGVQEVCKPQKADEQAAEVCLICTQNSVCALFWVGKSRLLPHWQMHW